jgi:hypothetical protein
MVGSYWPYSTSVWDYIHRAMPYYPKPGTLSYDETYAVTAYVLYLNKIVAKTDRMDHTGQGRDAESQRLRTRQPA